MILVAVVSCHRDRVYHQQIRETWASRPFPEGLEVAFFVGGARPVALSLARDEVWVDAPDDRAGLPRKVLAIAQHVLASSSLSVDWLFKCDTDTYVCLDRLAGDVPSLGEHHVGWCGYTPNNDPSGAYPPYGGSGYWLSHEALAMLTEDPDPVLLERSTAEDWWVMEELGRRGVRARHSDRYSVLTPPHASPMVVSYHPTDKSMLDPSRLRELHSRVLSTRTPSARP